MNATLNAQYMAKLASGESDGTAPSHILSHSPKPSRILSHTLKHPLTPSHTLTHTLSYPPNTLEIIPTNLTLTLIHQTHLQTGSQAEVDCQRITSMIQAHHCEPNPQHCINR